MGNNIGSLKRAHINSQNYYKMLFMQQNIFLQYKINKMHIKQDFPCFPVY